MERIIGHVKNYIVAYATACMAFSMAFGVCIEEAHADNTLSAAQQVEHLHSRTRNDNGQRTTIELRDIEK